ncbi:MAG TPA: paraquat-inducible protein A [Burkholderiaceae bacterium]|nr:paraquat-inducible protein A [Burkholderiaceae bacterium]
MDATTRRLLTGYGLFDQRTDLAAHAHVRPDLVVCDECDAVYKRRALAPNETARCARCGSMIGRGHALTVDGQLALAIAALLVFIIGNVSDIVTLNVAGVQSPVTLYESIRSTWVTGQHLVALLAGATAFAFPLAVILLRLYVLLPLVAGVRVRGFVPAMRALRWVTHWSMVEVFLFGALVAIVKSAGLASVILGAGIFSYAVLTFLLAANQAAGLHGLWRRASELR